jgi:hypothetical protein
MVRRSSFIIGLGLAVFWWIGLSMKPSVTMLWFDAVGAVVAFAIGGLVDDTAEHNSANAFGPAMLGLGLAAVWIAGIATRQPVWFTWVNFLFAAASLATAVLALSAHQVQVRRHSHA